MLEKRVLADLHLHTTASDGEFLPAVLVDLCYERGLNVISITDHDTVDGVADAVQRGRQVGVKVLAGIELSSFDKEEIHILGYNIPYESKDFLSEIKSLQALRTSRQDEIIKRLNRLGVEITRQEAESMAAGEVMGRVHIAKVMIAKGYCHNVAEAFDRFLGRGQKAFVEEHRMMPVDAVRLIARFGGASVLAHPSRIPFTDTAMNLFIKKLKDEGLHGIESEYFSQTNADKARFRQYAEQFELIRTGGSDFHDFYSYCKFGRHLTPDDNTLRVLGIE